MYSILYAVLALLVSTSTGRQESGAHVDQAQVLALSSTDPWINEFHYDNTGTDIDEGVEIAGAAGTD